MKLKKFKKNNKRNTMIIIAVVIVVGLVVSTNLIKSHAYFKTTKSFNVIQGKIPNKNSGDVTLAVKLDGEKYKETGFPSKEGHIFKGYDCGDNKEVNVIWDKNTWSVSLSNIKTKTTCILEFVTANNLNLNGSEPVVKEGLVPVIIANDGTVTKTEKDDINWYDYNESKWANAVILTGTDTYGIGDPIPESSIESYFVWIPKYRYKLFNVEGNSIPEQEIDIKIGDYDTENNNTTECKATNKSGDDGTCKTGMWMTHPAFTSLGVNGLWVGKFETGYKGTTADYNVTEPEKVQIKPNVSSWRNINVANMYNTSFNYKRNLDSHMMKNTEWGAMAYLANSKYGRPKDDNGMPTEVWINNNNNFVTGCVGSSVSASSYNGCENTYNTVIGYHGSTTDNISGIYDTSGGAHEYIMEIYNNKVGSSGFTESDLVNLNVKYYDKYTGTSSSSRILGDATEETGNWYSDYADFSNNDYPLMQRGGDRYTKASSGLYYFCGHNGVINGRYSFRLVLSPSN